MSYDKNAASFCDSRFQLRPMLSAIFYGGTCNSLYHRSFMSDTVRFIISSFDDY